MPDYGLSRNGIVRRCLLGIVAVTVIVTSNTAAVAILGEIMRHGQIWSFAGGIMFSACIVFGFVIILYVTRYGG